MRGLFVQQALGQFVRHPCRGALLSLSVGEDFREACADIRQVRGDIRQLRAVVLQRDVDQAAGIDHIVGRIENAAPFQLIGNVQVGQLRAG